MDTRVARYVNMLLGGWLFLSCFLWPHSRLELANTLLMGAMIIVVSATAAQVPNVRFLNILAAGWLIISTLYLRVFSTGTRWNNFAVGVFVALLAVVGRTARRPKQLRAV